MFFVERNYPLIRLLEPSTQHGLHLDLNSVSILYMPADPVQEITILFINFIKGGIFLLSFINYNEDTPFFCSSHLYAEQL